MMLPVAAPRSPVRSNQEGRIVGLSAAGLAAVGALAVGAVSLGALAVGRLAVGRLALGSGHARRLRIDELTILRLRVLDGPDGAMPLQRTASGHLAGGAGKG